MKTNLLKISFGIFMLCFLVVNTIPNIAQCDNTRPDINPGAITPTGPVGFTTHNSISSSVAYTPYQHYDGSYYVKIDNINSNGTVGLSEAYMMMDAVRAIITEFFNFRLLKNPPEEFPFWIKICIPGCFSWNSTRTQYAPCPFTGCCCVNYLVDKDPLNPTIPKITNLNIGAEGGYGCTGPTYTDCNFHCSNLFFDTYIPFNKSGICNEDDSFSWLYPMNLNLDNDPGKNFQAWFGFGNNSFSIVQLIRKDNNPTLTIENMIRRTIRRLLSKSNIFFQQEFPISQVTVKVPTCWDTFNPNYFYPCDQNNCCCYIYNNITKDPITGKITVDPSDISPCKGNFTLQCTGTCVDICDPANFVLTGADAILTKSKLNESEIIINSDNSTSTYVKPNPTNGATEIILLSDIRGLVSLQVFDISGKMIFNQEINKTNNELIFNIDMAKYMNGSYNYSFLVNDKIIISGKFAVGK